METMERRNVRGGVSGLAVVTGTAVALGAVLILTILVGSFVAGGLNGNVTQDDAVRIGLGAAIGLGIVQFFSYLWGGYTAGRMARGAGVAHGLLVPLLAVIALAVVGFVASVVQPNGGFDFPFISQLPVDRDTALVYGAWTAIGLLVTMFAGGLVGGLLGSRWHTKLERTATAREREREDRAEIRQREEAPAEGEDVFHQEDKRKLNR